MSYKYSTNIGENCAKAVGLALPISRKQSIMICKFIRNKNVQLAKQHLSEVILKKRAVPFTRFNDDMGHKAGMAAGRYPIKACQNILALLESAEANAQFKGLSTADLVVMHASAQKGPDSWRYGRHIRRQAKRTHIEIVLEERKTAKKEKKQEKAKPKETKSAEAPKKEVKPVVKEEKKPEVNKEQSKEESKPEAKKEESKSQEKNQAAKEEVKKK
ncbi:50S ribosomal protein L22 [Candidatus Woesearchaeota archaeon]|nr:50S ribosomal protein L22 [Candidatus Woesearchaeota archaeon]MBW3006070.1 50S ribosomal protein L22 [Candidatus Woesearchaeota archaeon]